MSRLVVSCWVRCLAVVAAPLLIAGWNPVGAQDEKFNIGGYTPSALCFSGDGKHLLVGICWPDTPEATYHIGILPLAPKGNPTFSTGSIKLRVGKAEDAKPFASVAVSPDGRTWATLLDGKIDLWDGITTKLMAKVEVPPSDAVSQLGFLDRRTLVLGGTTKLETSTRGLLRLWDTKANEKIVDYQPATKVQQLRVAPDGSMLTLIDGEDTVRLWTIMKKDDKYALEEKSTLKGHKGVTCHAVSPDGKRMLTGGTDKKVRLWDVEKSKEITFLAGHADAVAWVAFTADGSMPISWSLDGTVRLWDVEADNEARVWKRDNLLSCYQLSPDGTKLATGGPNGVLVWDLAKMTKDEKPK
jgi:WD40 repeat protein